MLRALPHLALVVALMVSCTGPGSPKTTDAADPRGKGADESGARPEAPPTPYVPKSELPTIEISAAPTTCPALPVLGADAPEIQRRLSPYAAAIRRLACEPALYGKTTAAVVAELGLEAEAQLEFSGPRTIQVRLPDGVTVGDAAAVFGFNDPKVQVTWNAYHPVTHLGTDPTRGNFDLFSPGRVNLGVDFEVDRYGDDAGKDRVVDAPLDARLERGVYVSMKDTTVKVVADDDAVPLVVSALERLNASPELLAKKPEEAGPQIGLAGERYRVAETSIHGATVIRGLSINPQRTVLPAAALAAALGLADARATCVNREHNVWKIESGGSTKILWKGLELDVDVDVERSDERSAALDGLEVDFILIYPRT